MSEERERLTCLCVLIIITIATAPSVPCSFRPLLTQIPSAHLVASTMLAPSSARVATRGATTPSRAAQAPAVARSGLHAAAAPERCCRRVAASSPQRRQQAVLLRAAAAEFPSATAVTTAAAPAAISSAPALQELNIVSFLGGGGWKAGCLP